MDILTRKVLTEKSPYLSVKLTGSIYASRIVRNIKNLEEWKTILQSLTNNIISVNLDDYYVQKEYKNYYLIINNNFPKHIILKSSCQIIKKHV
jgi:hypothetical protein